MKKSLTETQTLQTTNVIQVYMTKNINKNRKKLIETEDIKQNALHILY